MKTNWKSLGFAGFVLVGSLALGASPARAQALSFGYAGPGVSVGVTAGAPGYYGGVVVGGVYGGYPVVTPGPVVYGGVAPVVVPRPVIYPRPIYYGPRPFYGPRPYYYGGYRAYPRYWR
jgi:hypothetical protein